MRHSVHDHWGETHRCIFFANPDVPQPERETVPVLPAQGQVVEKPDVDNTKRKQRTDDLREQEKKDREHENPENVFATSLEEMNDPEAAAELQAHTRQAIADFHQIMQELSRRDGISALSFYNTIHHYLQNALPRELSAPVFNALQRPPGRFEYRANGQVVVVVTFVRGEYRVEVRTQPSLGQFRDTVRASQIVNNDLTQPVNHRGLIKDCQAYWASAPIAVRREIIRAAPMPVISNKQRFMLEVGQHNAEENDAGFTIRRSTLVPRKERD